MKTILLAGAVIVGLSAAQAAPESRDFLVRTTEAVAVEPETLRVEAAGEAGEVIMPEPIAVQPKVRTVGRVVRLAQAQAGNPPLDPALPPPPAPNAPRPEPGVPAQAARIEAQAARARAGAVTANRLEMIVDRQGREGRSLVISSHEPDPKNMSAAEEDLNVMSRILEKAMEQKTEDELERRVMGIRMMQGGDGLKNLLIEDYGAIFMLRANFPLSGPPEKKPENQPKETTNSTWEQTRREIYGSARGVPGSDFDLPHLRPVEQPFDPKRVENLKESLLESLKNAANIRGLKENDFVTVVVRSGEGFTDTFVRRMVIERGPNSEGPKMTGPVDDEPPKVGPRSKSTLTIRAKKADIDAFAKGKIDKEGFRKKVSMTLY